MGIFAGAAWGGVSLATRGGDVRQNSPFPRRACVQLACPWFETVYHRQLVLWYTSIHRPSCAGAMRMTKKILPRHCRGCRARDRPGCAGQARGSRRCGVPPAGSDNTKRLAESRSLGDWTRNSASMSTSGWCLKSEWLHCGLPTRTGQVCLSMGCTFPTWPLAPRRLERRFRALSNLEVG